jgi:hypothetical protein
MRQRKRQYLIRSVHRGPDPGTATPALPGSDPYARSTRSESRRERIAEAAYYRAQQRGFRGGSAIEDWLVAEAWVDAWLCSARDARSADPQRGRRTADRSHR